MTMSNVVSCWSSCLRRATDGTLRKAVVPQYSTSTTTRSKTSRLRTCKTQTVAAAREVFFVTSSVRACRDLFLLRLCGLSKLHHR